MVLSLISVSFCKNVSTSQCAAELAAITYSPNYEYKDYLISISKELKNIASFWKTPVGLSYVEVIAKKYNIAVLIIDAFGNIELVDPVLVEYIPNNQRNSIYSFHDARSLLNLGAYQNELTFAVYSFLSFSKNGVVYEVTLAKPTVSNSQF